MDYFSSPMSRSIIIITGSFFVIMVGIAFPMIWHGQRTGWPAYYVVLTLYIVFQLALIPFLCYLYAPKGYIINSDTIIIKRPWRSITIPISKIKKIWREPAAFKGTIRTCGNGGLFGCVGWFYSKALGDFRAYATDTSKAVIIDAGEKFVITPDNPELFIEILNKKSGHMN